MLAFNARAADGITLRDFKLSGDLHDGRADFTLSATAHVEDSGGGSIDLLSGKVAVTELGSHPKWHLRVEQDRFAATFDRKVYYPLKLRFSAAVAQHDVWNTVDFHVASAALQSITLQGLAADTQFQFTGAARPDRNGTDFVSYLPADGAVKLSWQEARPEAEGKLFYAAESFSQITVRPGLMRNTALVDFKVMQGEVSQVTLLLHGEGEVTRVQGEPVLKWDVQPATNSTARPLGHPAQSTAEGPFSRSRCRCKRRSARFPQVAEPMQFHPEGATRFAGWLRIVNEGAVRLEIAQASGLSQISPEQFPENATVRNPVFPRRRFATFRLSGFSGPDFALRIQADQILPELSVSEVLAYNLGENEQSIDDDLELDIREAPLRELLLNVPKGYAIARLTTAGPNDYFLSEPAGQERMPICASFSASR